MVHIWPKNQNTLNAYELSYVHHVYVEQNAEYFQSLYESDVCGVKPTRICACSYKEVLESHFLKHVRDAIRQTKEERAEVSLPWKEGFPKCLQFNRDAALAKFTSLEKRLNQGCELELELELEELGNFGRTRTRKIKISELELEKSL